MKTGRGEDYTPAANLSTALMIYFSCQEATSFISVISDVARRARHKVNTLRAKRINSSARGNALISLTRRL